MVQSSENSIKRDELLAVMQQIVIDLTKDFPDSHHPWLHADEHPELHLSMELMKKLLEVTGNMETFKASMGAWMENGMEISPEDWLHHLVCPHPTVAALRWIIAEARGCIIAADN